jgi:hypothetical protein
MLNFFADFVSVVTNYNKHAYAGVNDYFTHLRALLVLHNTAAFWPTQLALLGIIPPTEVTQRLVLWLGFYDSGTKYSARPAGN